MANPSHIKRYIRHGYKVYAPTEDSLSQHQTNLLAGAGYTYHNDYWRPPKPPNAETTLAREIKRRLGY